MLGPVEIRIAALIFVIAAWAVTIGAIMNYFAVEMPPSLVALLSG
jgi:Na+-translocating ferredoxin:NAD+ oxidoreductase RnfE subunit